MTINDKLILYGDARNGRSCASCYYLQTNIALGSLCKLCDLPTQAGKVCGLWCGEVKREESLINQGELF